MPLKKDLTVLSFFLWKRKEMKMLDQPIVPNSFFYGIISHMDIY